MKSVGIIAEYNPFHNGHLYHLNKVKEMFPNYNIILILSGNFLERGEASILDKYTKTNIALSHGIDLIVELPFNFATQSADTFAHGSIELLNNLNVEYLVFGSETNDIELLKKLANIQLNDKEYQVKVKSLLDKGYNYPTALSLALKTFTSTIIDTPNDILGLAYIKEIIKNKYNIKPFTIKRTNNYHDIDEEEDIVSATNIRNKIKNKEKIEKYVPQTTYKYLLENNLAFIESIFKTLKYKIITDEKLNQYLTVDEGIDNRIKKVIYESNNYEELIKKIKTKRYTYNKISRMLLHILVGYKKEEVNNTIDYIRVLGFNTNGKNYLKKVKKYINIPIITKFTDLNDYYQNLELKLSYIYSLLINDSEYIMKEIKSKVIIKIQND